MTGCRCRPQSRQARGAPTTGTDTRSFRTLTTPALTACMPASKDSLNGMPAGSTCRALAALAPLPLMIDESWAGRVSVVGCQAQRVLVGRTGCARRDAPRDPRSGTVQPGRRCLAQVAEFAPELRLADVQPDYAPAFYTLAYICYIADALSTAQHALEVALSLEPAMIQAQCAYRW